MNRSAKSKRKIWCFLLYIRRYSLTLLLSVILLSDVVAATPSGRELRIGQQSVTTQQDAKRAAQEAFQEGFKLYKQGTAESLRQAILKWEKALQLWRQLNDKANLTFTLTVIGEVYDSLGQKQEALKYYNLALPLYREVGNKTGEATTLNNLGRVYDDLGQKQEALKYYNLALPLTREVGDKKGEAITLNHLGIVYNSLGQKQEALKYFVLALPLLRAVGDKKGEATTLNNLGIVYDDLGQKQEALKYFILALPLLRAVGDKKGEAITLNHLGIVYDDLGQKQEALKYYNLALPLTREVGDKKGEAATLNHLGIVYDDLGQKQEALKYYNLALPLTREVGDKKGEAITLNHLGIVYNSLGQKQGALKYFNLALPLERAVGDKTGEATTLNNLGFVYNILRQRQEALKYYNLALPLLRAVGDKKREATTLNALGIVYDDLGQKQEALKCFILALPLYREVGDIIWEATTLNNLGRVYDDLGQKQEALKYFNLALPKLRAVGNTSGEMITLSDIAHLERNRGNLEQSLQQIEAAIKIIEDLRTKIDNSDLRTSYFASVKVYYKFYIDLLMQLHKKNPSMGYNIKALNASESSRARGLLELLTEAHADIRNGVDPKLLASEQRLQQLIDSRAKLLQELSRKPNTEAAIKKLKLEVENLLSQQQELKTKIRTTSPKYAALKYPEPLELPQIQQQLDKDTLLLEYSLGEEHSYLWAVTPNSIDTYELPGKKQIETAAVDFRRTLQQRPYTSLEGNKLSQIILAPVVRKLGKKRLVIVADGALQSIPFAALSEITPNNNKASVDVEYQPLIVNHEIVNLPSVTTIATQRKGLIGRKSAPKTLAILADPVFEANDTRVTGKPTTLGSNLDLRSQIQLADLQRAAKSFNRDDWGRLEGTRKEADAILKLVKTTGNLQALDFDANYNWATSKQLAQYRFLHFATHGFADPDNPELSGIVLSLVDKQGRPTPQGYLRLGDIFNLNFSADLIVMSACQTGLGKDVQGEGLVGLTRGLMYAGTPRVAVSLWNVSDDATAQLMQDFYTQILQQGKSPTTALREAQLKLRRNPDWNNPYYWAAFTLVGEWR